MKAISPSQLEGISKAPQPQTVGQMMTFLGMTGLVQIGLKIMQLKQPTKSTNETSGPSKS